MSKPNIQPTFVINKHPYNVPNMAARSGLEPKQTESESVVLPLHHRASPVENESTASTKQYYSKIQEKNTLNMATQKIKSNQIFMSHFLKIFTKCNANVSTFHKQHIENFFRTNRPVCEQH